MLINPHARARTQPLHVPTTKHLVMKLLLLLLLLLLLPVAPLRFISSNSLLVVIFEKYLKLSRAFLFAFLAFRFSVLVETERLCKRP